MSYPAEYILQCGYYPDTFASKDIAPDTFFMHVHLTTQLALDAANDAGDGAARLRYRGYLLDAVESIIDAVKDKYRLDMGGPFSQAFNVQDCFWSCALRPDDVPPMETTKRDYVGADDEYPENAS